jgi:hypothetical protein
VFTVVVYVVVFDGAVTLVSFDAVPFVVALVEFEASVEFVELPVELVVALLAVTFEEDLTVVFVLMLTFE